MASRKVHTNGESARAGDASSACRYASSCGSHAQTQEVNGEVNGGDLGILFATWGTCPSASFCRPDLDRDGKVDGGDLGALLAILGDPTACD